ncbi:hypothetical protein NBRC116589_13450 [Ruegeria sp. HU-ET01832]|uniref:group I intron-associated PD-(D/E)XK endonuclease n=1 Tax=Ruegeria sp. HU-ET01832 TaxID=3135906 RepID=UPI00310289A8
MIERETILEWAVKTLEENNVPMHVNDIAAEIAGRDPGLAMSGADLSARLQSVLLSESKKKGSRIKKPLNRQKKPRKGMYRVSKAPAPKLKPNTPVHPISTQNTGAAGEHAVVSELLYRGFNASKMAVDDGIDIVASKENSFFHIQVKTSNQNKSGSFSFTVPKSSFSAKDWQSTYYVFVLRRLLANRYINDFIVLPNSILNHYVSTGVVSGKNSISLTVTCEGSDLFKVNKSEDVTKYVNNWSVMKGG